MKLSRSKTSRNVGSDGQDSSETLKKVARPVSFFSPGWSTQVFRSLRPRADCYKAHPLAADDFCSLSREISEETRQTYFSTRDLHLLRYELVDALQRGGFLSYDPLTIC